MERSQETKRAVFLHRKSADRFERQRILEICEVFAPNEGFGNDSKLTIDLESIECATLPFYSDCYVAAAPLRKLTNPNQLFFFVRASLRLSRRTPLPHHTHGGEPKPAWGSPF
jgi:hypothetical protein